MSICVIAQPIHPVGGERLKAAGVNVVYPREPGLAALADVIGTADAVIVRDHFPAQLIDAAPNLRVIANHGTGTDKIDVAYAHAAGIPVAYTPDANVRAVAEHALMLMLATARRAAAADAATRSGNWRFKYDVEMLSLYDKTLGIVGWGRTGRLLARMAAQALGMRVLAWSPRAGDDEFAAFGVQRMESLEALLREADVVSLHRPLRADTARTLDAAALAYMKPDAIVINTSRGGLIDEAALVAALSRGRLFGAGLDVFEHEPLPTESPLCGLPNVLLTPHVAGSSREALIATASQCAQQVIDALHGRQPANLVDAGIWARRRQSKSMTQG
ncbi:phosphoglycerate dehydrogenase [Brenneria goodwinii]|uniref:Phosphoglycerate dehydrogenase n=1 Tax=Brenneria goodwinii TaxID=1109412 RepID=A0A0G4JR16_9GAMM|nr:hydroxyacid dehydrogenase [Brenneria goodwinii]ATA25316.1 phosphoglycerate dehydrogenase [Brenneria goodwinii]MCG8158690.1 hydroxyacid dehydrogenase [Brenneria goodwinii]MCG8162911.1 hydroxyacid dehydrogenase [Brenneria goodwinii]MCG8167392.1 hydroxyacid dehydrogenase [Brenneria goodwinii]MCG8172052.1 hydroxyacid dehydrogenase [Brenneria goodwinii]